MSLAKTAALYPDISDRFQDIPNRLWLGWISAESGGNVDDATDVVEGLGGELGLFQLSEGERKATGFTDEQKILSDVEYSADAGRALIDRNGTLAAQLGAPSGTELYWWTTKLIHAIGFAGARAMYRDMTDNGQAPQEIDDIRTYFKDVRGTNDKRVALAIQNESGHIHYPSKGIARTDSAWSQGLAISIMLNIFPGVLETIGKFPGGGVLPILAVVAFGIVTWYFYTRG